mmetsp:Transcript_15525/g.30572  ORF Transcript_15525/g.30572 Transcript_15525/m.30572 type:complete len:116 (+) Transcript_15525:100-447(+)
MKFPFRSWTRPPLCNSAHPMMSHMHFWKQVLAASVWRRIRQLCCHVDMHSTVTVLISGWCSDPPAPIVAIDMVHVLGTCQMAKCVGTEARLGWQGTLAPQLFYTSASHQELQTMV